MSTIFLKSNSVNTKTKDACVHLDATAVDLQRQDKEEPVPIFSAKRNAARILMRRNIGK
jgi:hypothetical protein